jgi:hypothetical protein
MRSMFVSRVVFDLVTPAVSAAQTLLDLQAWAQRGGAEIPRRTLLSIYPKNGS